MRYRLAACALLAGVSSPHAHSEPRAKIVLPDGCAFIAHAGHALTPADRCATMLGALQQSFERSALKETCDSWPALGDAAVGTAMPRDRLRFIPLKPGRFLMQVLCTQGAYNANYLFFAYDETRPATPPALLVFATHPVFQNDPEMKHWGLAPYEPRIAARSVNPGSAAITAFAKGLGDGSIGHYARWRVDRTSFVPTLQLTVVRNDGERRKAVDFSARHAPRGEGWQRFAQPRPAGCLASLEKPACP